MSVLGINAGGTRTVCLLADDTGAVKAEARGPGANLQSAGELEVEKVLHLLIDQALGTATPPSVICLGMAGVDRPGDADTVRSILQRIGHRARILVVNDALIALEAGVPDRPGTVVIAGTGSIAYGRDSHGHAARAGGWGYVLGDEGSGYWLGRQALRAVVRAADGRGAQTALTALVLEHYRVAGPRDLVHAIYAGDMRPATIAALARSVGAAAAAGDGVACHLVGAAARELAAAAVSVARRLDIPAAPILLAGGALLNLELLTARVEDELASQLPHAPTQRLTADPAVGAVRLACAALANRLTIPTYQDPL